MANTPLSKDSLFCFISSMSILRARNWLLCDYTDFVITIIRHQIYNAMTKNASPNIFEVQHKIDVNKIVKNSAAWEQIRNTGGGGGGGLEDHFIFVYIAMKKRCKSNSKKGVSVLVNSDHCSPYHWAREDLMKHVINEWWYSKLSHAIARPTPSCVL